MFSDLPLYAGDPIFSLVKAFLADERPGKVNLSIGVYQNERGQLPMLESVRKAELQVIEAAGARPYLPMEGLHAYRDAVQALVFGADSPALAEGRVVTFQTLGGGGALRLGADFLRRHFPGARVWLSDPSWDNHPMIFETVGFEVGTFPYYNRTTGGLRFAEMLESFERMAEGDIVVLQPCCHNPTGVDPTRAQWNDVLDVVRRKRLLPFMDMAYQGLAAGLAEDAFAVRLFAAAGIPMLVAQSLSKNMSYYGERIGSLSVVAESADAARLADGQLQRAVRVSYSNPPTFVGRVAAMVLGDAELRAAWEAEVTAMRQRILSMRQGLHRRMVELNDAPAADYLLEQKGMFSFTGLSPEQVDHMRETSAVYLVRNGRICLAALTEPHIDKVARAMAEVATPA